ncbi:hypothetical protein O181_130992, partial [Austropuccinia psidii MF-1]|nr:hypothetical protein [Austropuccinia psidii MF-1]
MDLPPSSYHDSLEELWDEEEEPEELGTVMKVVPSFYHQYFDVFSKVKEEKLPPLHAFDHRIELEGSLPGVGVTYSLSNQESDTLRAYISENLEKGFIWPSSSSRGAPFLFVKRSMVASIDLHGAYNLLRIKEGDENLTAFRIKYGSFEYLVMPFGLTNAPASFQNLVNDIFQDLPNFYVLFYLYDIMIFSKSEEEHVTHVSTVLSRLKANNLFAKASKCLFHFSSVEYLGYVVSSEGLKLDQVKSSRSSTGLLQETSRLFNHSLALPISTAVSSKIFQRRSVHSPVSSRKIPVSPSMRKLSVSFTNIKRLSPPLQSFSTHH